MIQRDSWVYKNKSSDPNKKVIVFDQKYIFNKISIVQYFFLNN